MEFVVYFLQWRVCFPLPLVCLRCLRCLRVPPLLFPKTDPLDAGDSAGDDVVCCATLYALLVFNIRFFDI